MGRSKDRLMGAALRVSGDSEVPSHPANTRTTSSVFIFRQGLLDVLLPLESSVQCHAQDRTQLHTVSAVKEFCQKEERSQKCTNNLFLLTFT